MRKRVVSTYKKLSPMLRYCSFLLTLSLLVSFSGCGYSPELREAYSDLQSSIKSAQNYNLTQDEDNEVRRLSKQIDEAYEKKDMQALEGLAGIWAAFYNRIEQYKTLYESATSNTFSDEEKEWMTADEKGIAIDYEHELKALSDKRDISQLQALVDKWDAFAAPLHQLFDAYKSSGMNKLSSKDKKLLTTEQKAEYDDLAQKTDAALDGRDLTSLSNLKSQWSSYNSRVQSGLEKAREEFLQKWLSGANLTSSLTNFLSFGMVESSTRIDGHKIVLTTQYNTNNGVSDEDIKASLESYLKTVSSAFQAGADYLRDYIDDSSILVEYKNKDGKVVASKEFVGKK